MADADQGSRLDALMALAEKLADAAALEAADQVEGQHAGDWTDEDTQRHRQNLAEARARLRSALDELLEQHDALDDALPEPQGMYQSLAERVSLLKGWLGEREETAALLSARVAQLEQGVQTARREAESLRDWKFSVGIPGAERDLLPGETP